MPPGFDDDAITHAALRAKAGDRAAATAFIETTQRAVRRFLAHLCDARDIDDLTQETYLRAMTALPRFAGRSSARTWLLTIARNVAADHVRLAVRRPRTSALDPDAGPRTDGFEDGIALRYLLDALAPERREAFVATQVLGLGYAEAAEVCGCPIGTIRSRVARAREDLVTAYHQDQPRRSTGTR